MSSIEDFGQHFIYTIKKFQIYFQLLWEQLEYCMCSRYKKMFNGFEFSRRSPITVIKFTTVIFKTKQTCFTYNHTNKLPNLIN